MKKIFFLALILTANPLVNLAQEVPKIEIFGGYSYFRMEGGTRLDQVIGPSTTSVSNPSLNGWNASVTGKVNRWLGLVGDFGGHYGHVTTKTEIVHLPPSIIVDVRGVRTHSFLFGPRIALRQNEKFTPFVHILLGEVRQALGGIRISPGGSEVSFGMALGGGLDLKVKEHLAVRVLQADYFKTRFGGDWQNNVRLSFGLVGRF